MDKYIVAPPNGSTNNGIGAADRPWKEGHFEKLVADDVIAKGPVVDVRAFGAKGDGVTDDTAAFTAASAAANLLLIPPGTYIVNNVIVEHNIIIFGYGATLTPKFVENNAQNIITVKNADYAHIIGVKFYGDNEGTTRYDLMRNSALECKNLKLAIVKDCTFDTISHTTTSIEENFADRKGAFTTFHDVDYVLFDNDEFIACGADESNWVAPQTKERNNTVIIRDCITKNYTGLSVFDIIADTVIMERVVSDSTDHSPQISWTNLLCKNVIVRDCKLHGEWELFIDTHEAYLNMVDSLIVEGNVFDGRCKMAVYTMTKQATIKNNIVKSSWQDGPSNNSVFVALYNQINSDETMRRKYAYAYESLVDEGNIVVCNNYIVSNNDGYAVVATPLGIQNIDVILEDNLFDMNNKSGAIAAVRGGNVTVNGNEFRNTGKTQGASTNYGVVSCSTLKNFILTNNIFDKGAGILFGKNGKIIVANNSFDEDALSGSFTNDKNLLGILSCQKLKSDTLKIDAVPAKFEGEKVLYTTPSLTANINIGDVLTTSGQSLVVASSNGSWADSQVSTMPASATFERGWRVQLSDGSIVKIITYGTYQKSQAPNGASYSIGDYISWGSQEVLKVANQSISYKTITGQ